MRYTHRPPKRRWPKRVLMVMLTAVIILVAATVVVRYMYNTNLQPASSNQTAKTIEIKKGTTVDEIAKLLQDQGLIRSAWAFKLYVSSKELRGSLQAGTYDIAPSESVADIVSQLTHGKIVTNLVLILPGQRLDQIEKRLIQDGFSEADVKNALNPANYAGNPALVDKPPAASLEGYLYPDSYQRTSTTTAKTIVSASLSQMNKRLTPDLRSAFAKQGLSTYRAIILASIIEKEVPSQKDRDQVAQVFLKRLSSNMRLQSNVTSSYGAIINGAKPSSSYPSEYNTYLHDGLPPTPVGNVSLSSLKAVAYPANTDWLYFVSGDDGVTHYAKTLADHEAQVQQYCTELCGN